MTEDAALEHAPDPAPDAELDPAPDESPGPAPDRAPRVALIALIVIVAAVVVAAVLAVLLRGGPAAFDPQSPEGVVQRYTQALIAGDLAAVQELRSVDPRPDEGCGYYPGGAADYRVTLAGTTVDGDSARVRVLISTSYGDSVFGSGGYQTEEVFRLTRSGDGWLIAQAPWQFTVCAENMP